MASRLTPSNHVLVLTGPTAGDISCALAVGIPAPNIWAIDQRKEYVVNAKFAYPACVHKHVSLDALIKYARSRVANVPKFDFVCLDLCGPLTPKTLTLLGQVFKHLVAPDGYLSLTFMCGRECPNKSYYKNIAWWVKREGPQVGRWYHLLGEFIRRRMRPVHAEHTWFYTSVTGASISGLPMGVALLRKKDGLSPHSSSREFIPPKAGIPDLLFTANVIGDKAAALLNVPPGTLAAWRAHATRGTYEE